MGKSTNFIAVYTHQNEGRDSKIQFWAKKEAEQWQRPYLDVLLIFQWCTLMSHTILYFFSYTLKCCFTDCLNITYAAWTNSVWSLKIFKKLFISKSSVFIFLIILFGFLFVVLGVKPRALCMLSICFTTELHPSLIFPEQPFLAPQTMQCATLILANCNFPHIGL